MFETSFVVGSVFEFVAYAPNYVVHLRAMYHVVDCVFSRSTVVAVRRHEQDMSV